MWDRRSDPDKSIAQGAAWYAYMLANPGKVESLTLHQKNNEPLQGIFTVLNQEEEVKSSEEVKT